MEVCPGVHRVQLPLKGSPLGHVNSYLLRSNGGYILVDCGWDTPESMEALRLQTEALGIRLDQVHTIMVTHIHPDHYGMAGRIRDMTGARLLLHRLEKVFLESRYANPEKLAAQMGDWLRTNGAPEEELDDLQSGSLRILNRVRLAWPDQMLDGGEHIPADDHEFEVVWTPGHSAGHICLYDRKRRLLLSGDHVLPRISPNISLHVQAQGNPLADYLDSLQLVAGLDIGLVLPGHGDPFHGLAERVQELASHHQARLAHLYDLLADGPHTGYQVALRARWSGGRGWDSFSPFQRRMAMTETLAHLELLRSSGRVRKLFQHGIVLYARA